MLLESLNALVLAGDDALQTTCGLSVVEHHVSLIRQGSLTFPALGQLHLKGAPLQDVHLGCDSLLCGQLAGMVGELDEETGIEALTRRFLDQLVSELEGRHPRGKVHHMDVGPTNLASRGLRTFGLRLETGVGQLFVLAEVPSRMELELAKGSDYVRAMEATYLPREWSTRQALDGSRALENFLVFLRKVEGDVYFEVPGTEDVSHVHSGILLDNGTFDGVRGLKFCTDLSSAAADDLRRGDDVWATVGIGDRSLRFRMSYLGAASHSLANGAELPCAFFRPPELVNISQRRLAFRIPVKEEITAVLHRGVNANDASPWGDEEVSRAPLLSGVLADLSFSGARIIVTELADGPQLELNSRVVCDISFPELDAAMSVLSVVRRIDSRLADRNERQQEIGLEFLIAQDTDRTSLDYIRQYVLSAQRACLAQRIQCAGLSG